MLTFLQKNWWVFALRGLAAVIFGILALVEPITAIAALVLLWGAYALVDGIFGVFAAFKGPHKDGFPWWMLIMGLVSIAAGVYTFMMPAITALVLLYMIAGVCIVRGVLEISAAIRLRKEIDNEWWLILAGAASLIFGILLFLNPGAGALALIVWIGIMAIIVGVLEIILGFKIRNRAPKAA